MIDPHCIPVCLDGWVRCRCLRGSAAGVLCGFQGDMAARDNFSGSLLVKITEGVGSSLVRHAHTRWWEIATLQVHEFLLYGLTVCDPLKVCFFLSGSTLVEFGPSQSYSLLLVRVLYAYPAKVILVKRLGVTEDAAGIQGSFAVMSISLRPCPLTFVQSHFLSCHAFCTACACPSALNW